MRRKPRRPDPAFLSGRRSSRRAGRTGTPAPVGIQSAASCCSPLIARVSAKADLFVIARHEFSVGIRRTASQDAALHVGRVSREEVAKRICDTTWHYAHNST